MVGRLSWMKSLNPWTGIWLCFQFSEKWLGVVKLLQILYSEQNLKHSFTSRDERWLCKFFNTGLIIVTWSFSGRMFSNMNIICPTPVHSSFLEGGCVGNMEYLVLNILEMLQMPCTYKGAIKKCFLLRAEEEEACDALLVKTTWNLGSASVNVLQISNWLGLDQLPCVFSFS